MPTLDVFDEPELPEHLRWQIVAAMRELWPSIFTGGLEWITHPCPPDAGATHIVVHHGDVLVSYASLMPLRIPHGGADLAVAGLGNVITAAPYRGRGHAAAVQTAVNAALDHGDADVAALFCDSGVEAFYTRTGWVTCPGGTRVGSPEDNRAHGGIRMMRFLSARGRAARAALTDEPFLVAWTW
jgi:GNAT superfamily N-acetyltransferase